MSSPAPLNGVVLNSWKEIASHLGRGVRTVQRWERDLGMPVRRPRAKSRSAVIAMADEIDAWLRKSPTGDLLPKGVLLHSPNHHLKQAMEEHSELRDRCSQLRSQNHEALAKLMASLTAIHNSVSPPRKSAEAA
jgi:hypothetical protein